MKTEKVKIRERKKTLTKRLKEQQKNLNKVSKRIHRLKRDLWKQELKELELSGLLQELNWEYEPYVDLCNLQATGIISKETTENNKTAQKLEKWFYKHHDENSRNDHLEFFRVEFRNGDYKMVLAMKLESIDPEGYSNYNKIVIFASDVEETGSGQDFEIITIEDFTKLWKLKTDVDMNQI